MIAALDVVRGVLFGVVRAGLAAALGLHALLELGTVVQLLAWLPPTGHLGLVAWCLLLAVASGAAAVGLARATAWGRALGAGLGVVLWLQSTHTFGVMVMSVDVRGPLSTWLLLLLVVAYPERRWWSGTAASDAAPADPSSVTP